jgi:hypothetical protein
MNKQLRDRAEFRDTLERIKTEWVGLVDTLGLKCDCGPKQACSVCEITHLLAEALEPEESGEQRCSR